MLLLSRFAAVRPPRVSLPLEGEQEKKQRQLERVRHAERSVGDGSSFAKGVTVRTFVRMLVDVRYEERYWYPDDGGIVWLAGYQLVDPESGRFLARDAPELAQRGLHVASVAGAARFHDDVLQSDAVAPGAALVLRRDPANAHDPNAIAVLVDGGAQAGWVPRELAVELAADLDAGRAWSAVILRERRASPRDPRTGVTMLLAPAAAIELRT